MVGSLNNRNDTVSVGSDHIEVRGAVIKNLAPDSG